MTLFRGAWHLVTRFAGSLRSRPLSPRRQDDVRRVLRPAEAELFFRQQPVDQRHAYVVAQRVATRLAGMPDAIAAALLHDVGKVHSSLGPVARSLATLLDRARLPMPDRWRTYRDHGRLGAADLRAVGARPLAVAFAARERVGDRTVWNTLIAADDGPGWGGLGPEYLAQSPETGVAGNSMPPEVS